MRAHDDGSRHSSQMRDVNAKAFIRAAALDFAQEDDVLAVLLYADAIVDHTAKPPFQLAELVVMRRKQCLGADLLFIHQIFHNGPRDAQAVKRAGASTDFIKHNQRL